MFTCSKGSLAIDTSEIKGRCRLTTIWLTRSCYDLLYGRPATKLGSKSILALLKYFGKYLYLTYGEVLVPVLKSIWKYFVHNLLESHLSDTVRKDSLVCKCDVVKGKQPWPMVGDQGSPAVDVCTTLEGEPILPRPIHHYPLPFFLVHHWWHKLREIT